MSWIPLFCRNKSKKGAVEGGPGTETGWRGIPEKVLEVSTVGVHVDPL